MNRKQKKKKESENDAGTTKVKPSEKEIQLAEPF